MRSSAEAVPARAIEYLVAEVRASAPFTDDEQTVSRIVPWEGGFALVSTDGNGWRLIERRRSMAMPRGARLLSKSDARKMLESSSPASRATHQARAAKLAAAGRGGDTEVAHVAPGEIVLHPSQLSPRTLAAVVRDLARRGIRLGQVSVGSPEVRRNPLSGAAEFDPTPPPSEPGLPTYWVQEPNGLVPGRVRPIIEDGPARGLISDLNIPRPDLSAPSANWGNVSDPYGAWGRAGQGTGPMQIGRTTPISDAAAAGGLINYRQNNLPDGWTARTFGAPSYDGPALAPGNGAPPIANPRDESANQFDPDTALEAAFNDPEVQKSNEFQVAGPQPYSACDRGAMFPSCEGWVPNFLKEKGTMHMPTSEELALLPDSQKEFYADYYAGLAGASMALQMWSPAIRKVISRVVGQAAKHFGQEFTLEFQDISDAYRNAIQGNREPQSSGSGTGSK